MTLTANAQQEQQRKIDAYLDRLRTRLRGFDPSAVGEIVEELRSHILDKAAQPGNTSVEVTPAVIDAALAALGSPEELADQYVTDNLLARAETSRSPLQILRGLFRWGSLSVAGFFILLGAIFGYFLGVVFMLVAVAKLFHPHTAGLWIFPNADDDFEFSFRMGFASVPPGGREVLGWWIVPIGWLGGGGLVMLTTYIAVWFVHQYRRSLGLPSR